MQIINNTFVVYFNPKRSVIINSSILIVSAATIEVCSQFIKDWTMTIEKHNILIENNIMLKQILAYIASRDGPNIDFKEFAMNIVANLISNNTDGPKQC